MNACPKRTDTLLLDVHGELGPREQNVWNAHLRTCTGCRLERERLLSDLRKIRHAMTPPPLSAKQHEELVYQVRRKLEEEKRPDSRAHRFRQHRMRFIPAIAVACLLIMVSGVAVFMYLDSVPVNHVAAVDDTVNGIQTEDLEILQHFELLENMPTLEKLVHIVEPVQGGDSQGNVLQDFRGKTANGKDPIRV